MQLPDRERVAYEAAPLVVAAVQILFPRLLEFEQQVPVAFQKAVASKFPDVEVREGKKDQKIYDFSTVDNRTNIALTHDALHVSTSSYTKWEDFREYVDHAFNSLRDVYNTQIITRIALRYQNLIVREAIGLDNVEWKELITPHAVGILSAAPTSEVLQYAAEAVISLERGSLKLRYGLAENETDAQIGFLIDCEVFDETRKEVSSSNVLGQLDEYHCEAGRAFRWCISDRLHAALRPSLIVGNR